MYLIYAKESYELIVDLPPGAAYLAAAVDGEQVGPRFLAEDRLALPLPAGEGVHRVRLRWVYGPSQESLAQPKLAAPRLHAAPALAMSTVVTVPPGYYLAPGATASDQPPALEAGLQELGRADALGAATKMLIEQYEKVPNEMVKAQILLWQKRFVARCRLAAQVLEVVEQASGRAQTAALRERLDELRRRNTKSLRDAGLEKVRAQAEKSDLAGDKEPGLWLLPTRGTVFLWPGAPGSAPPTLTLLSVRQEMQEHAWLGGRWVLLTLFIFLVLTAMPRVLGWLASLWPELLLLLALAGCLLWGFSLIAAALFAAALAARFFLAGAWIRRRWLTPLAPPA
jgi:hypothetical protein